MKRFFGKVDLFAPFLGDIEAIILCNFDFHLKKKKSPSACLSMSKLQSL